jgi:hypothetical protein
MISYAVVQVGQQVGVYLVWKDKTVLEEPGLLHRNFHMWIVGGSVDLRCSFPEAGKNILNLRMGVWAVIHGGVLEKFGEEQRILAYPLNRLHAVSTTGSCESLQRNKHTLTKRSPIVSDFFEWS